MLRRSRGGGWAGNVSLGGEKGQFHVWLHKKLFWNNCDLFRRALERICLCTSFELYRTFRLPLEKFRTQLKVEKSPFCGMLRWSWRGGWAAKMCHWAGKKGQFHVWVHKKCFWNNCDLFRRALEIRCLCASFEPYRTFSKPLEKFLTQL